MDNKYKYSTPHESYCSFELCVLLEKVGFDMPDSFKLPYKNEYYDLAGNLVKAEFNKENYILRPTIMMAIDWVAVNFKLLVNYKINDTAGNYVATIDIIHQEEGIWAGEIVTKSYCAYGLQSTTRHSRFYQALNHGLLIAVGDILRKSEESRLAESLF